MRAASRVNDAGSLAEPKKKSFLCEKIQWLQKIGFDHEVSRSAAKVAVVLSRYLNEITRCAWPSVPTLTVNLGMSETTVRSALRVLEKQGYIRIEIGGGRNGSNRYHMLTTKEASEPSYSERSPRDVGSKPLKLRYENPSNSCAKPSKYLTPNPFKNPLNESSPLSPEGELGGEEDSIFEEFEKTWPWEDKAERRRGAFLEFQKLSKDDQRLAVQHAPSYVTDRKTKNRKLCHAKTYLIEKGWEGFCADQDDSHKSATRTLVVVFEGTPQAEAWNRYARLAERKRGGAFFGATAEDGNGMLRKCCYRPAEWPPD